ncbi:hypothetical protein BDR07DRAFT_1398234, partial [Suillus spraguei]
MRRLASQIFVSYLLAGQMSSVCYKFWYKRTPSYGFISKNTNNASLLPSRPPVIAALTVSMTVSADSQCTAPGAYCTMDKDECCSGFTCVPKLSIIYNEGQRQKAPYICVISRWH